MVVFLEVMVILFWKRVQGDCHIMIPKSVSCLCIYIFQSGKFIVWYLCIFQFFHLHIWFWKANTVSLNFVHLVQWLFVQYVHSIFHI
jgi:hypothetical protein